MTLGERICKECAARNLSQSDLAEALEVSRQSVSKWETDTSVPDLDKLVKMCELFEVSMDRLARGSEPEPPEGAPPAVVVRQGNGPLPVRIIVGLFLLSFGFLAVLLMLVNSWALLAAVPFLVCGAICLACKKEPRAHLRVGAVGTCARRSVALYKDELWDYLQLGLL